MKKYIDVVFNREGQPISGASVRVKLAGTSTDAVIYSDNGITPKSNPVNTNTNGEFSFYVEDGRYDLVYSGAGLSTRTDSDVVIEDAADKFSDIASDLGSSMVGYMPSGTGAVATTVQDALRGVSVSIEDFGGGVSKSATVNASAIQAGIDYLNTTYGGGFLDLPGGVITSNPFVQKTGVILCGKGINATELKLANGANADFIVSQNFSTLTGQNKWLASDGVQHGLGFKNLRINGNKANQSAGDGVKLYAKRLHIENVLIYDVYGIGWYSEAGDVAGQTSWYDLPESQINGLWVRYCGSHGFQFRGPHDAYIGGVCVNQCGGKGVSFETSAGVYNGSADINFAHIYANTDQGFYSSAQIRGQQIISESNHKEGVQLDSWYSQISMLQVYDNCRTSGTYNCVVSGRYNTISQVQHKNNSYLKSGISVTGQDSTVTGIISEGNASTGTGVVIASTAIHSSVQGVVRGFSGVGGTGVITNSGGACSYLKSDFVLENNSTCWNNSSAGYAGQYRMVIHASAGQVGFTGQGPAVTDCTESWDVVGQVDPATTLLSEIRKLSGGNIDLNTTAEQTITIGCSELLGLTPEPEDVTFGIYYSGSNTTWELAYLRLASVTSSLVTFKLKLRVAAGAAETAKITMTVKL